MHRETGIDRRDARVFVPQALRLFRLDLDIGVVLHQRQDALADQFAATHRILFPVVAIRSLRRVDIPGRARVAFPDDVVHQFQCTGHHGAAAFAGREEIFLIDFAGHRVVTDEHQFDALVALGQEQIEQHEKALGDVLAVFIH